MRYFISTTLLSAWIVTGALAQTPPPSAPVPDAAKEQKSTTIISEQLRMDFGQHQSVFTGSVVVTGPDFEMKSTDLTIYTGGTQNKIERLVARGHVSIVQPDRTATAEQVEYTVATDKMFLTGTPVVTQNKNRVTGNTITIYRGSNRMDVDGRSKVVIYQDLTAEKK
jgi:lipopolysaccharide export system protein LptA